MPKGIYKRKPFTIFHKQNISRSQMGHKHSKKTKEKIRQSLKGHKHLKKSIEKMRISHIKTGRIKHSSGYILVYQPTHPFCRSGGYIKRSRLVMEQMIGRYLKPEEQVHHKGIKYPIDSIANKQDDREENLYLCKNIVEHCKLHKRKVC